MKKKEKKSEGYSSAQEAKLLNIPYHKGKGAHTAQLHDLADKWGRTHGSLWQKWYSLHNNKATKKAPPTTGPTAHVLDKKRANQIAPMVFTAVEFDQKRMKIDPEEEKAMQKGLEEAIIGPLSNPKRAILFPTRMMNRAKEYLIKNHPRNVFSFHTNKKDKRYMLLAKKS